MINTYIFLDTFKDPKTFGGAILYLAKAYTAEEAWKRFAKYAKDEFGLESASVPYVRDYFQERVILVEPNEYIELLPRYPEGKPTRVAPDGTVIEMRYAE